jgi:alpha-beta hydrolase superfamily lysophospholipase
MKHRTIEQQAMVQSTAKTFILHAKDGTQLKARRWLADDESTKRAVVGIVHGLGEHCGRYEHVARQFNAAGFEVISYDQRGHGPQPGPLPAFDVLLNDVSLLIESAEGSAHVPFFLYGQSLGGCLVMNYALRFQPKIEGVISTSPLLTPALPPPAWKLFLARTLYKIWPTLTLGTGVQVADLTHDEASQQAYLNDPIVHHRISSSLGHTMLQAGLWALNHADQLELPMLLMHGTEDRVTSCDSSRQFADRAGPLCTLKLWEGLYHDLHWECEQQQVIQCMVDWMNSILDGKSAT